ncbi:hypothetical protein QR680_002047 [Steinernema hermaphroditum]|uniref:Uncharacterized protein n=1 Tax=Steinernema hermaphroditum TaxID=289476 RepID=A0AA39LHB8_9BILA|nr:hypothetical protein QR680_002047 [Steinernema hermaphroditum]
MLAPIVTKDMKLFPSRPLPPYVKNSNVRARAQSLDEIGGPSQTKPFRQRNAQSVGHLPGVAKSPPKRSSAPRTPLDSIKEGVELGASSSGCTKSTSTLNDASDSRSVKSTGSVEEKKSPRGSKKIVKWITGAFKKSKDSSTSSSPNDDEQLSGSPDNEATPSSLTQSAHSSLCSS